MALALGPNDRKAAEPSPRMSLLGFLKPPPREARLPQGEAVYAVGDVHGRLDLLKILVERIRSDRETLPPGTRAQLIFLGDYIDRGPESAGVVELVVQLRNESFPGAVRTLKGNHEDALLTFLGDARMGPAWSQYGGAETVRSYGVRAPLQQEDVAGWEPVRLALQEAMPESHLDFYRSLEPYVVLGDYCFVHAGLRPGTPIADQAEQDLLSIRTEFLNHRRPFEKKVIYGHTPTKEPVVEPHRIGIDTGAFATGVLTALKLWDSAFEMIQARA